jgi:hypothetical protein
MWTITKAALSIEDIANYWSREIDPPRSKNELLDILVSAWWLGELHGDSAQSRLQLLKIMFTSTYRDDLGIIFIVGHDAGPPEIELPDGSLIVNVRHQIRVRSSNTETWDEAVCRDAFQALADITEKSSIAPYGVFAIFLPSIKMTYEEYSAWRRKRGDLDSLRFWRVPLQKRKPGRPREYDWVGVRARLETHVSQHGPIHTTEDLLQKCADFATDLHPKNRTPSDKTMREAIATHAFSAAAGLVPGK